ncbi:MAG: DNA-3-methyladenine glycosylase [Bacteroidota bacterium]
MKLEKDFYTREDVVLIAKELLGKYIFTKINEKLTAGIITETEAYAGVKDRACHAYNNLRTKRTEVMYAEGGVAYVYFCYGMHHLFNIVTNKKNIPEAILIRAVKPIEGIKIILRRRKRKFLTDNICSGPGTVTQALGIKTMHTGITLTGNIIWIEDRGIKYNESEIKKNPRIGVNYAGTDALLPYRFGI